MHRTFKLSDIRPNPARDLKAYPPRPNVIEDLRESIRETDFWENVVARELPDGTAEIAYGHHRLEALRREFGEDYEVELIIKELTDEKMLDIMIRENAEEWSDSPMLRAMEAVEATVRHYAKDRIELPAVPERTADAVKRFAPGFAKGRDRRSRSTDHPYTASTLAESLPENPTKIKHALRALEAVETGDVCRADFAGLSMAAAADLLRDLRESKLKNRPPAKPRSLLDFLEDHEKGDDPPPNPAPGPIKRARTRSNPTETPTEIASEPSIPTAPGDDTGKSVAAVKPVGRSFRVRPDAEAVALEPYLQELFWFGEAIDRLKGQADLITSDLKRSDLVRAHAEIRRRINDLEEVLHG